MGMATSSKKDIKKPRTLVFEGPCLFLTCLEEGKHYHAMCPYCETLNYVNVEECEECQKQRPEIDKFILKEVEAVLSRQARSRSLSFRDLRLALTSKE